MTLLNPSDIDDTTRIVDVRSRDEYLQAHIPGSRNIPLDMLGDQLGHFQDAPVILTCRSGHRAAEALAFLEAHGCTGISLLEGGLQGWKLAGKPIRSLTKGPSIMQQVQMIAGSLILMGSFFKPLWFLAPLAGVGLLTAGLTNTCLMASLLSRMPWNRMPKQLADGCTSKPCSL